MPRIEDFGVKPDPTKDYRTVDERQPWNSQHRGFTHVSGTKPIKGLVLMERSKDKAIEEQKEREKKARDQQYAVRERIGDDVERLSSKHGKDLHKYVKKTSFED